MSQALRVAARADIPALDALIPRSTRELQAAFYSQAQIDGALGTVFAVDRQLIDDGTYFVVEAGDVILGCGGWSKRKTLFGGDHGRPATENALLDPEHEAARIRAFFVHPGWARRGIGRRILDECEHAAGEAGFKTLELVATLAGVPLYAAGGFRAVEHFDIPLANGSRMPVVRMSKTLAGW
jgi:GNAT superfamily N-acetyltransferase